MYRLVEDKVEKSIPDVPPHLKSQLEKELE